MQMPNIENTGIENEGVNPSFSSATEQTSEVQTKPASVGPVEVPKVEEKNPIPEETNSLPISVGYPLDGNVGNDLSQIKPANLSEVALEALAKKIKSL